MSVTITRPLADRSPPFRIASKADRPLCYRADQFLALGNSAKSVDRRGPDRESFSRATIAPGKALTGSMVFDVPIQEKDVRLVVDAPSAGGQVVEIKLAG